MAFEEEHLFNESLFNSTEVSAKELSFNALREQLRELKELGTRDRHRQSLFVYDINSAERTLYFSQQKATTAGLIARIIINDFYRNHGPYLNQDIMEIYDFVIPESIDYISRKATKAKRQPNTENWTSEDVHGPIIRKPNSRIDISEPRDYFQSIYKPSKNVPITEAMIQMDYVVELSGILSEIGKIAPEEHIVFGE